jgi:hypothetical protein
MRFTEYVTRFVRLASRYEEEITGSTTFGFPSAPFAEIPGQPPRLGSGIAFSDEATSLRELAANAHRIEAWRRTSSYKYLTMVVFPSVSLHAHAHSECRIIINPKAIMPSKDLIWSIKYFDSGTQNICWMRKP